MIETLSMSTTTQHDDSFLIFTHSSRSRVLILVMFFAYAICYGFLTRALRTNLEGMENLPAQFVPSEASQLVAYAIYASIWLLATGLLLFLVWALFDIWGLQVHLGSSKLMVTNTITGNWLSKWFGVGLLDMEAILKIRGSAWFTQVSSQFESIRFTPVDRLDLLIEKLMENAKNAQFDVPKSKE